MCVIKMDQVTAVEDDDINCILREMQAACETLCMESVEGERDCVSAVNWLKQPDDVPSIYGDVIKCIEKLSKHPFHSGKVYECNSTGINVTSHVHIYRHTTETKPKSSHNPDCYMQGIGKRGVRWVYKLDEYVFNYIVCAL